MSGTLAAGASDPADAAGPIEPRRAPVPEDSWPDAGPVAPRREPRRAHVPEDSWSDAAGPVAPRREPRRAPVPEDSWPDAAGPVAPRREPRRAPVPEDSWPADRADPFDPRREPDTLPVPEDSWPADASGASEPLAAPASEPPPGERYERLGLIGAGGMGRVWLARDRRLGRMVALKEPHDDRHARRLAREARVTAGLEHPGVITVYDEDRAADGRVFYTMRLMRGRPLSQTIAERPDLQARLGLLGRFLGACQAVAYAHAQGVLHRDLKPANIVLGAFDDTQVVDWGLARRLADAPDDPPGAIVGTPAYMSPEQARGEPGDRRADVWSLGVVLRELLAGSPAAALPSTTPPELAAIVARAGARDPADRYADAGALAADVAAYLDGRRVEAHRYTALEVALRFYRAWRVPVLVGGAALVVIAALVVLGTLNLRSERDRAVAAEHSLRLALADADRNLAAALVAQARAVDDHGARAVTEVLAAHALRLADTPAARGLLAGARAAARPLRMASAPVPTCHPIVALDVDDVVCADGSEARRVVRGAVRWRAAVERQIRELRVEAGRVWAVQRGFGLATLDLETGAPDPDPWDNIDFNVGDAWPLRSDRQIGIPQAMMHEECAGGFLVGVAGLIDGPHVVLCADGRIGRADRLEPAILAPGFEGAGFVTFTHMALSPDATRAVVAGSRGRVAVHDLETRETWSLGPPQPDPVRRLVVGPDGQHVAVARERGGVEVYELPALHPVGTIAVSDVRDLRLDWDGSVIVTDGAAATRWLLPAPAEPDLLVDEHGVANLAFSPDGRLLASAHGEGRVNLWELATGERRLTHTIGSGTIKGVAFFPAGDRLAVVQSDRGPLGPHVLSTATGERLWTAPRELASIHRRVAVLGDATLVAPSYGVTMLVHDLARGRDVVVDDCPVQEWQDLATDPHGRHAALVNVDASVHLLTDGPRMRCRQVPAPSTAVAADVSADAGLVVVGAARSLMRTGPGGEVWTVAHPGPAPLDVALSPDERWIATAGPDDGARLWRADDGRLVAELTGHDARVAVVEFSPDGALLATGSWDGTVRLWDLATLDAPAAALLREAEAAWGLDLEDVLAR
ncbi:MAG: protein kinase [Myxococcales bacterium]|nr:protein kinase [Myxococcales bacterium]